MVIFKVYNKYSIIFRQIGGTFLGCIVQLHFLNFTLINYYVPADVQSHIFCFLNFQEIFFGVQFCFHLNFCNFSDISLNYSIFSMVLAFFLLIAIVSVFCCWYWNPDFCIQLIFPTKFYIGFSAFFTPFAGKPHWRQQPTILQFGNILFSVGVDSFIFCWLFRNIFSAFCRKVSLSYAV